MKHRWKFAGALFLLTFLSLVLDTASKRDEYAAVSELATNRTCNLLEKAKQSCNGSFEFVPFMLACLRVDDDPARNFAEAEELCLNLGHSEMFVANNKSRDSLIQYLYKNPEAKPAWYPLRSDMNGNILKWLHGENLTENSFHRFNNSINISSVPPNSCTLRMPTGNWQLQACDGPGYAVICEKKAGHWLDSEEINPSLPTAPLVPHDFLDRVYEEGVTLSVKCRAQLGLRGIFQFVLFSDDHMDVLLFPVDDKRVSYRMVEKLGDEADDTHCHKIIWAVLTLETSLLLDGFKLGCLSLLNQNVKMCSKHDPYCLIIGTVHVKAMGLKDSDDKILLTILALAALLLLLLLFIALRKCFGKKTPDVVEVYTAAEEVPPTKATSVMEAYQEIEQDVPSSDDSLRSSRVDPVEFSAFSKGRKSFDAKSTTSQKSKVSKVSKATDEEVVKK